MIAFDRPCERQGSSSGRVKLFHSCFTLATLPFSHALISPLLPACAPAPGLPACYPARPTDFLARSCTIFIKVRLSICLSQDLSSRRSARCETVTALPASLQSQHSHYAIVFGTCLNIRREYPQRERWFTFRCGSDLHAFEPAAGTYPSRRTSWHAHLQECLRIVSRARRLGVSGHNGVVCTTCISSFCSRSSQQMVGRPLVSGAKLWDGALLPAEGCHCRRCLELEQRYQSR